MSTDVGVQVSSLAPEYPANFDDTGENPVSSRLSGIFHPGNFFIFPLRTKGVFTQLRRLELLYAPFWGVIGPPLLPVLEKNIFYFRKIKYTKKFKCRIVDFAESIIRHFCFIAI